MFVKHINIKHIYQRRKKKEEISRRKKKAIKEISR